MTRPDWPWRIDTTGRTAQVTEDLWLRELVEQVLFTQPGERPMRPEFGSNIHAMLFEPNGAEAAAVVQSLVSASLQRWLGDRLRVQAVEVRQDENNVLVRVSWIPLRTGEKVQSTFTWPRER